MTTAARLPWLRKGRDYTCPVCLYPGLQEPPTLYSICPCCGTEFENDDELKTHAELRADWIAGGMEWWSQCNPVPDGWDPVAQLQE